MSTRAVAGPQGRSPASAGDARRGVADMLPIVVGYAPFAAVVGGAVAAHPDPVPAWLATPLVYGGAAQLAVLQAVQAGSGAAVAVAAGLLINARLLVYSAGLAPRWAGRPVPARMLAAALLTDASWAVGVRGHEAPGTADGRFRHYLGAAATLAGCWLAMVTAAALLGSRLPLSGYLAPAVPLCLLALLAPALVRPDGRSAVAAAVVVAVGASYLPDGVGLPAACAAAAAVGLYAGRGRR